ncbi:hypothetical protein SCOR_29660 [Sulfidibacter corallicola]
MHATGSTEILGPTRELIQMTGAQASRCKFELIERNDNRLQRMVDQLLELSRLGIQLPSPSEPTTPKPVVTFMQHSFQTLAAQKRIRLEHQEATSGHPPFSKPNAARTDATRTPMIFHGEGLVFPFFPRLFHEEKEFSFE